MVRNQTTEYTYDGSDHVLSMTAVLPGNTHQTTQYIYSDPTLSISSLTHSGTTATATVSGHHYKVGETVVIDGASDDAYNGTFIVTAVTSTTFSYVMASTPSGSGGTATVHRNNSIFSNDLLTAVDYPDLTTGDASASQEETFTYNALGQQAAYTDRNGTTHQYSYDVLGRATLDAITTLGDGVDDSVMALGYNYNDAGLPYQTTSYDDDDEIVNQIQDEYNGLGQLVTEYQEHNGEVDTGSTLKVQYAYGEMADGANQSRPTEIIYPNGRIVHYGYSTGLDDAISRISYIYDSGEFGSEGAHLEEYSYLGLSTVVERAHPETGVDLTYIKQGAEPNGDAGDQYTGLDRFSRIVDQRYIDTSTGSPTDQFTYGYDLDGNVLWQDNLVNSGFGEIYSYDSMNRLTSFSRGTLNMTKTGVTGSPDTSQGWTLDANGNWTTVTTDGTPESRAYDAQNQITSGGLSYDANGNLVIDATGASLTYDAWNRLVSYLYVTETIENHHFYTYDAQGRRIYADDFADGTDHDEEEDFGDLYYSKEWQVIEERMEIGDGFEVSQYVWSPVGGTNNLVLRDRDANQDGDADGMSGDGLEERLYVQQNANGNITALVDTSGAVVERYVYDPYGSVTILDASWNVRLDSSYDWHYLFQGQRYDAASNLYDFRYRIYDPTLGRFLQQDPMGYVDGANRYQFVGSNPLSRMDPWGTYSAVALPGNNPSDGGVRTNPDGSVVIGNGSDSGNGTGNPWGGGGMSLDGLSPGWTAGKGVRYNGSWWNRPPNAQYYPGDGWFDPTPPGGAPGSAPGYNPRPCENWFDCMDSNGAAWALAALGLTGPFTIVPKPMKFRVDPKDNWTQFLNWAIYKTMDEPRNLLPALRAFGQSKFVNPAASVISYAALGYLGYISIVCINAEPDPFFGGQRQGEWLETLQNQTPNYDKYLPPIWGGRQGDNSP